jgi:hypothetical protein
MISPYLEKIGFGLYANSSAQFDNILIYNTAFPAGIPSDTDEIFHDDYSDYDLWNRYVSIYGTEIQWNIIEDRLEGQYPDDATPNYGWLITQGLEYTPELASYTIKVKFDIIHTSTDEIFLLGWGFDTRTDPFAVKYNPSIQMLSLGSQNDIGSFSSYNSYTLDEPLTWGELIVAVGVKDGFQHTDVYLSTMDSSFKQIMSHEENVVYSGGNIGVGMIRSEYTTETLVCWDELDYRRGYHGPDMGPGPDPPTLEDFGVKIGDTFTYQLTRLGPATQFNLAVWFNTDSSTLEDSFLISQGDKIKLIITEFKDYGIFVDVYQNDGFLLNARNNFFFLPINTDLTNLKMFDDGVVVHSGDQYMSTMTFRNETTDLITGEVEFRWDNTTGVLETVEVTSGVVLADNVLFDNFYFELTSSTADSGTNTIPSLTPGWDIVTVMGSFLILPIYLRKRNRN